ncbi:ComEC/Rec2 family competence protein, partial [Candidatus Gracilibacteria bacterium]|nr:ComEC/Rec2 family competence protein [Candidatus Gracilibacteria bacterium]
KNEAIFLGGILLGARESLSDEIKEDFNNSGLTHFIAVSGFNITILILFVGYLIKYFPRYLQAIIILAFIIFFVAIVGNTAPVLRAAIMGFIGYIVLISGRKGHSYTILIFTAAVMVIVSPLSLNADVSLHLSFLAVLGIIFTQDFYKKLFSWAPSTLAIQEALILTFAALTFTLPLMLFNFGQVSILSPLANISVTWTIPIAMLLGFITIIVYIVSPFIGEIFGYLTWILLKFDMLMVQFFGNLEFSVLKYNFGVYKTEFLILYFIFSTYLLLYFQTKKREKR